MLGLLLKVHLNRKEYCRVNRDKDRDRCFETTSRLSVSNFDSLRFDSCQTSNCQIFAMSVCQLLHNMSAAGVH